MSEDRRTFLTYYAYQATTSHGFWMPYAYVFLLQQGFDEATFGFANAAFLFSMVLAEVPAGYVGDRFGRRASLALGNLLSTGVFGLYVLAGTTWHVVLLFAVWGVGFAFHSATGDAWLYDLLADADGSSTDEFAHLSGRSATASLAVSAGGALAATPLYWFDPSLPFLANAALSALGVPLLAALPATRDGFESTVSVREALQMLRVQAGRPEVRWLVGYVALFNVLFSMTRWLEQPALDAAGVPLAGFGVLYAAFQLTSAAGTSTTGWVQATLGARTFFLLLAPLCGLVYGAVAVVPMVVIPVIFLRRTLGRVITPILNKYLNDRLDGVGRATVLSGVSMAFSTSSGVANAAVGPIAKSMRPDHFLPVAGVAITAAAVVVWVATSPVRLEPETPTDDAGATGHAQD